jgi:serine/threonine protein kinase
MNELDLYPVFQIQKKIRIAQEDLQVPLSALPKESITGAVLDPAGGTERCRLSYKGIVMRGAHGSIHRVERRPAAAGSALCIKRPVPREYSLCPEALLQWLASNALEAAGVVGAVPRVHDIFQFAGETRFSMDYVDGVSSVQAILESDAPERTFTHILAQAALLLGHLQCSLGLDHRDLKADNLWIRRGSPVHYRVRLGSGRTWSLTSPFQVVLLDFGFACLGGADGNAVINLSDGVLPKIDPCPKEGRDLFQLLVSLWSVPAVREKLGAPFQGQLRELLAYHGSTYDALVQMTDRSQWSYLVVSDAKFKHPPLQYETLLETLRSKWLPTIQISKEDDGSGGGGGCP